jgi:hypothetical protein
MNIYINKYENKVLSHHHLSNRRCTSRYGVHISAEFMGLTIRMLSAKYL